jgi:hypothetical protein
MHHRFQLAMASSVWLLVWAQVPASAQFPPVAATSPRSTHPTIPPGWKQVCSEGPDTGKSCPILKYNGYTYWAWSDVNNHLAIRIVAYDPAGTPVKQWDRTGVRYVWRIDVTNEAVAFVGQANDTTTVSWDDLAIPTAAEQQILDSGGYGLWLTGAARPPARPPGCHRHFYNKSDVSWEVQGSPRSNFCESVGSCVVPPRTVADMVLPPFRGVHITLLGDEGRRYRREFSLRPTSPINCAYIAHGSTGRNVVVNDPADGDIRVEN